MKKAFAPFPVRTAIVTGAASGIGALKVERLRAAGVNVVAGDRNPDVESARPEDAGYRGRAGDVTDPEFAAGLVRTAQEHFGPVDLLFHAAGIMPGGTVADSDSSVFLRVMDVNYAGTVHLTKAVLPGMRAAGRGQIVVLGSITGYVPTRGFSAYSASKAAVNTLVEILAREEAEHGVQVLLAAPNAVKTPLLAQVTGGPKLIEGLHGRSASWMLLTPAQVLDAIDKALARGKTLVEPRARLAHAARRLSPALVWAVSDRFVS